MSSADDEGCGPYTDPASKDCTLPGNASPIGLFPNEKKMSDAIESRYGKATDPMSGMKSTSDNPEFSGPGQGSQS